MRKLYKCNDDAQTLIDLAKICGAWKETYEEKQGIFTKRKTKTHYYINVLVGDHWLRLSYCDAPRKMAVDFVEFCDAQLQ